MRRLAIRTRGVEAVATLPALLNDSALVFGTGRSGRSADAVLTWGRKPSAEAARRFAARHGLPLVQLEDGFLRSVGLGDKSPPLSIVVDDLGIYYDATAPSRLESLIVERHNSQAQERAANVIRQWRCERVSKYNHQRSATPPLAGPYVLVVDQTRSDASIRFGQADGSSFTRMLEAALDENPGLPVLIKQHPDVTAGRKQGHFSALTGAGLKASGLHNPPVTVGRASRIHLCIDNVDPASLLESAHAVYVVTSQMGFEGLLWGKPVRTFGMPFYAGWGLTGDALPAPSRRSTVTPSLGDLVHAALIDYPRYIDPETGRRCEVECLMAWMGLQRRMRQRFAPEVYAVGFSRWKKPIVRAFLGGSDVRFVRRAQQAPAGSTLAVWGRRDVERHVQHGSQGEVLRLEDGFLRSVGLGADLVWPLSWAIDRSGIYYDATKPSDLERLLQAHSFDAPLLARARALREQIVALGLTKYNVGTGSWHRPAPSVRVILVPGQVETDASITLGAPGLRSNLGLLQAVRKSAPDAYVVYRPHPDVVARLRSSGVGEEDVRSCCDEVVTDCPMNTLLDAVDEVHVLTSLAGFEALLRGRRVVTYGCPFYAGWGLTTDRIAMPRRTRPLSLDALVAGVLIAYPTYIHRGTRAFTTPERTLLDLAEWRSSGISVMPVWRRALRTLLGVVARVRRR